MIRPDYIRLVQGLLKDVVSATVKMYKTFMWVEGVSQLIYHLWRGKAGVSEECAGLCTCFQEGLTGPIWGRLGWMLSALRFRGTAYPCVPALAAPVSQHWLDPWPRKNHVTGTHPLHLARSNLWGHSCDLLFPLASTFYLTSLILRRPCFGESSKFLGFCHLLIFSFILILVESVMLYTVLGTEDTVFCSGKEINTNNYNEVWAILSLKNITKKVQNIIGIHILGGPRLQRK